MEREGLIGLLLKIGVGCIVVAYLTACSAGGQKFFCGWEEVNAIKNTSGYEIPKEKK